MMAGRADRTDPSTSGSRVATRVRPLRSVRVRITLAAAAVTAAAMAASGWLLVRSVKDSQLEAIRNDTEDLLDLVTERLAAGVPPEETIRPDELTTSVVELVNEDGERITFVPTYPEGDDDEVVSVANAIIIPGPAGEPSPADKPEPGDDREVLPAGPGGATDTAPPSSNLEVERRTRTVDTPSGEVTVTVTSPADQVGRSLDAVRRALTMGLPLLVVVVAGAAWWMVGRALRPVERIRVEADAISASTMHLRLPEPGTGDEVDRLSKTMNAMLERLEDAVRRQRQFVADASHELRNPVAGIRTDLEVALSEGGRADWANVGRAVLAEEARLETLIGDLLVLAAEDEGAASLPETAVDLSELAATEARRTHRVPVSAATGSDHAMVVGSRIQLQRALANLVDNAARHASSRVQIGIASRAGWAELRVDDDGPGIPPADRERVFERFTRLDDGRARDQGGSGLGLAVVCSIVTRHGGSVRVADSPLGGAGFIIALPTTPNVNVIRSHTASNARR
jgi:signal transduction histidine kinase